MARPRKEPKLHMIYINTRLVQMNEEDGENRPVVTVDDPFNANGQKDVRNLVIKGPCRVIYNGPGKAHERGPRVWIETEAELEYDE